MGLNQLRNTLKLKITWFQWKFHWTFISIFLKNIDIVWYRRVGRKHITKGQDCCHIILFFSVPCLNFDHVIIMKGFHNIFAYYRRSKPKEIKCQKKYILKFHMAWCYNIFVQENIHHNILRMQIHSWNDWNDF